MRKYGQQDTQDISGSPKAFNELYAEKLAMQQIPQPRMESNMGQVEDIVSQTPQTSEPLISKEAAQGFSRGQSGGLGTGLLSAGVSSGNPYLAGAGVGTMIIEGNAKAKQAQSEAEAIEAQNRKQAQLASINNLISVTKGLSVS